MSRVSADEGPVHARGRDVVPAMSAHADGMRDRSADQTPEEGERAARRGLGVAGQWGAA